MSSVTNPSFETAGPLAGIPNAWHRRGSQSGGMIAVGFADRAFTDFVAPTVMEDGSWTRNEVTLTVNASAAPDGSMTADRLTERLANALHYLRTTNPVSFLEGHTYTVGCYLKAAGRSHGGIAIPTTTGTVIGFADLTTGRFTLYPTPFEEIAQVSGEILVTPNGWVRVALTFSLSADLSSSPAIHLSDTGTVLAAYAGDASKGIDVWGAFLFEGNLRDSERFDGGWDGSENRSMTITAFEPLLFETGLADPITFSTETFESGWQNNIFAPTIGLVEAAVFDAALTPELVEDFADGWQSNLNDTVYPHITASTAALFDGDAYEDFSTGWSGSENRSETIAASTALQFDGDVPEAVEDFEEGFVNLEYTVDTGTEILTSAGHGRATGDTVYVTAQVGGKLPTGTNGTVRYFIEVLDANTLKLHTGSAAGPTVNFQDTGDGTQYLRADPVRFWTGEDIDTMP